MSNRDGLFANLMIETFLRYLKVMKGLTLLVTINKNACTCFGSPAVSLTPEIRGFPAPPCNGCGFEVLEYLAPFSKSGQVICTALPLFGSAEHIT